MKHPLSPKAKSILFSRAHRTFVMLDYILKKSLNEFKEIKVTMYCLLPTMNLNEKSVTERYLKIFGNK